MRDVKGDTGELVKKVSLQTCTAWNQLYSTFSLPLSPLPLVSVLILSNFLKMHKILSKSQVYPLENPFVSLITAISYTKLVSGSFVLVRTVDHQRTASLTLPRRTYVLSTPQALPDCCLYTSKAPTLEIPAHSAPNI